MRPAFCTVMDAPAKIFFDTEFSSLLDPHLWSVGLVTLDGRECYAELDTQSELGRQRWARTPWDVRESVADKFGLFPEAIVGTEWDLGQRVGGWLLDVAQGSPGGRIELCYDYGVDLDLLVGALEECNLWPQVRLVAGERNIARLCDGIGPELASEAAFRMLRRRPQALFRHHALADALALRAAWRTWCLVQERSVDFLHLLRTVGDKREGSLYEWLASPSPELGGDTALDVLEQADGLHLVIDALRRVGRQLT